MSKQTRYEAIVDLDVINAEDDSSARQAIFNMLSAAVPAKSGRPTSGARAAITGIRIINKNSEQEVFKAKLDTSALYGDLPESSRGDVLDEFVKR